MLGSERNQGAGRSASIDASAPAAWSSFLPAVADISNNRLASHCNYTMLMVGLFLLSVSPLSPLPFLSSSIPPSLPLGIPQRLSAFFWHLSHPPPPFFSPCTMNNNFQNYTSAAMAIQQQQKQTQQQQNDISQPINISFSRNNSLYHNPKLRRDSIAHSQGMGGISWGSVGIGSWLKDEVLIHHNNNQIQQQPYRHQSINLFNGNFTNNNAMDLRNDSVLINNYSNSPIPNSSYLADLEANYCKDYSCCGQLLPTLHDLLKHYEEMHISNDQLNSIQMANANNVIPSNISNVSNIPTNAATSNNIHRNINNHNTTNLIGAVSTNEVFLNNHLNTKQNLHNNNKKFNLSTNSNNNNHISNTNNLDATTTHNLANNPIHKTLSNFNFDQSNNANTTAQSMQFDFNPNSASHIFHNEALVNDLEDQAKMFQQQVQQHEEKHIQNNLHNQKNNTLSNNKIGNNLNNMTLNNLNLEVDMDVDTQFDMDVDDENHHHHPHNTNSNNNPGNTSNNEIYIDDPARRLYVIEQQDERPFQCPVIGCDKTYKNQNGLKYHRIHGHQNQTLRENSDGSLSVINPDSDSPYPNGMGLEKDKPYRCEVCGKRYKNLNGLKYHRGHTTH